MALPMIGTGGPDYEEFKALEAEEKAKRAPAPGKPRQPRRASSRGAVRFRDTSDEAIRERWPPSTPAEEK